MAELISKIKHPKLYLANYFKDLKSQVDLIFAQLNKNEKYLETIKQIELFEQNSYNNNI